MRDTQIWIIRILSIISCISVFLFLDHSYADMSPSIVIQKTNYSPGEQIQVRFTAPSSYASDAWIGIIPSSVSHGSEANNDMYDIAYIYIQKRTNGTMVFVAPSQPGSYDLRMHTTDNNGVEVFSVSFTVKSGSAAVTNNKSIADPSNQKGCCCDIMGEANNDQIMTKSACEGVKGKFNPNNTSPDRCYPGSREPSAEEFEMY
jgi:hypothetical protein